jgi:DNA polymerase III epsilon subunit-like protein
MAAGATESREVHSREGNPHSSRLYFFYDCEASGGSAIRDQMIEVAAVVMTENLGLEPGDAERLRAAHYSSLCRCSSEIQEGAWLKHGIDRESLAHERPVGEVLEEMFDWFGERAKEVERLKQRSYQTILVAHGGIAFDFPLLVTEAKRSHCEAKFRDLNLQFADTHVLCQQLKTARDPVLRGSTKLSVSQLQSVYFPTAEESPPDGQPHRALSDAVTLRRTFTQTPLSAQMSQLELVSTEDLLRRWQLSDDTHQLSESLGLHKQKAKSLARQGESLVRLEEGFRGSGCSEQWLKEHLCSLGVKRPGQTCLQHFRKII